MKNPVITFSLIALMAMPAMAQEEAATAAATDDGLGLSTGATIVYSNVTGELDKDGKAQEMEDMSISSMIININAEYSLAAAVDGLYLGLDLPIVQNSVNFEGDTATAMKAASMDTTFSTMGLGDLSLYVGYDYSLSDTMNVGGQLRFKAATGADETKVNDQMEITDIPIGSGFHNLQASVMMDMAPVDNLSIDIDAGYIITLAAEKELEVAGATLKADVDPADGLYANMGFGYTIADMVTPRLGVHYFSTGTNSVDGTESEDSDMNALGVSLNVDFKINDSLSANAGLGSNMISRGINLPYGHVLMGKNASTGMGFNVGVNATF